MSRTIRFFLLTVGIIYLTGCATHHAPPRRTTAAPGVTNLPALMRTGVAEIDITPPVGFRMAGYFDERISTAKHDPLKAKALVFKEGSEEVAMVFCDLLGVPLAVTDHARAEASRATGIPVTNIIVAATHSHTGPLFNDVREEYLHRDAVKKWGHDPHETIDYPVFLTHQIVRVITEARANIQYAHLVCGVTNQPGITFNRRYYMKTGGVRTNPGSLNTNVAGPAGPVDSDIDMLLVKNKNNKFIGGLTVFATHADTTTGTEFSADYPYWLQEKLRSALGSNYISAFGAGTCGDLNHIDVSKVANPVQGFPVAKRIGETLAQDELNAVTNLAPVERPRLALLDRKLNLPLQPVEPREVVTARLMMDRMRDPHVGFFTKVAAVKTLDLSEHGTNYTAEVQVIRIDADTAIVCLPDEIFVEFGLAIKRASPFKRTFVITICNDRIGYVPTMKAFEEGSYEVSNSRFKPGAGEIMTEAAIKMLNQLYRSLVTPLAAK